jgi:hypothetical protein
MNTSSPEFVDESLLPCLSRQNPDLESDLLLESTHLGQRRKARRLDSAPERMSFDLIFAEFIPELPNLADCVAASQEVNFGASLKRYKEQGSEQHGHGKHRIQNETEAGDEG